MNVEIWCIGGKQVKWTGMFVTWSSLVLYSSDMEAGRLVITVL